MRAQSSQHPLIPFGKILVPIRSLHVSHVPGYLFPTYILRRRDEHVHR